MKILELIVSLLSPDYCLGCSAAGTWLCEDCTPVNDYPEMCHVCKKPSIGSLTCKTCATKSPLVALHVCYELKDLPKELVWKAKYQPSRSAARLLGDIASKRAPYLDPSDTLVQHIPTAPSRIRERAFDQADLIAAQFARCRHLTRVKCLKRLTYHHQVGSTRKERIDHMKNAFGATRAKDIQGKTIVLVDDVYTTGATMESAARTLRKAGAKRIVGIVFARA